jgi:phage tail-like protein
MDVNGTRHQLLLGKRDWARCTDDDGVPILAAGSGAGVEWDPARAELRLRAELVEIAATAGERALVPGDRRGADRDRHGSWYWIGPERKTIAVRSAGSGKTTVFWAPGIGACAHAGGGFEPARAEPVPSRRLAGLAVTADRRLVVGVLDRPGLLCFDLLAGGPPLELLWPPGVAFAPFDVCARERGGVAVLDREHRRLWKLDRRLGVAAEATGAPSAAAPEAGSFGSVEGGEGQAGGAGRRAIAESDAIAVEAFDPVAVAEAPDGSILVLDRGSPESGPVLVRLEGRATAGRAVAPELAAGVHDLALLPPRPGDEPPVLCRAFVALDSGNQTLELIVRAGAETMAVEPERHRLYPMRLYNGKALVAAGGAVHYDQGDRFLPLVDQRRRRYERTGILRTPALDGRTPGCVWHRLMLDACLPPGGEIRVESRAADDEDDLELAKWGHEPRPLRRPGGSEIPYLRREPGHRHATYELLFQRARGRYLQLCLTLAGDSRATPALRAVRAYYPRFSYLERYLPAAYSDDPVSASFLDRFLANPEGIATAIEDRVASFEAVLDPRSAPAEQLGWLAGWLGATLDPAWDEGRRRLFVARAVELFRQRGTARGLELALRLTLDPCLDAGDFAPGAGRRRGGFRIVERFRARRTPGPSGAGPAAPSGPRTVEATGRWRPEQGADLLHDRYRTYMERQRPGGPVPERFPLRAPEGAAEPGLWRRFCEAELGFVPAAEQADAPRWRAFLARRYATVDALNAAHGRIGEARVRELSAVPLPAELPAAGAALADWFQFEGVVLAMERAAYRFTVLVPVVPGREPGPEERRRLTETVQRVTAREKPAHTSFDVRFFWLAFRLGEARLGDDTAVDLGARSPGLLPAAVLGRDRVGEGVLAAGPGRGPVPAAARSAPERRQPDPDERSLG